MRARVFTLAAGVLCMVAAALPATSVAASASKARLSVSPTTVVFGETVTVRATGFAPLSTVDLFVDETDVTVVLADGRGDVQATLDVLSGFAPGRHWITAKARGSNVTAQRSLRILSPASDRPQEGNDAGRTGAAPDESILTPATAGDLQELWWRDLEVLRQEEEVFVTDAAGEISEPSAVGRGAIVATWFGDVVDEEYRESSRTRLVVLDLDTGAIRWALMASPATRWGASRPVILGDLVVVRWNDDRVLLGLSLADGTARWRLTAVDGDRFGEPLVAADRVLIPVDRPGPAADAVWLVDAKGRTTTTWNLPKGSYWRIYAGRDVAVAINSSSIVALDRTDGSFRWARQTPAWWGSSAVVGDDVVVPMGDGKVEALRLRDGSSLWTWQAWPRGCDGCQGPLSSVSGASNGVVYVRSFVMVCPAGEQSDSCPHRVRLSALELASGTERWFRQGTFAYEDVFVMPIPGPVQVTPDVLVGADGVTDVRHGTLITAFQPPVHPGAYGAQHFWYARPIVTGGRVVMGAADGTITVLAAMVDQVRPDPAALVVNQSLNPPTPTPTVEPTVPSTLAPTESTAPAWVLSGAVIAAAVLLVVWAVLIRRRHAGTD